MHTHTHTYCAPAVQLRSILTSGEGFLSKQSTQGHSRVMHITYMQLYLAHRRGELVFLAYTCQKMCYILPFHFKWFHLNGGQTSITFRAFSLSNSPA